MIEYKHPTPIIRAQQGIVLAKDIPEIRAKKAQQENARHRAISEQYFNEAPSVQNIVQGVYHWIRGSEWSPFSKSEDPDDYKYITGTAPTVSKAAAKRAIKIATNAAKRRYFNVGKKFAERQAKNVVGNTTKKGAETTRTESNKINTFWGNRMNWWETPKNSTASKPTRFFFNTGRVVLGAGTVAPFIVREATPTIINNSLENWGIDYRLPVRSDSTKTDTTKVNNQTPTQQPTQYKTLDSLENAAIQVSKQLVDSIYDAD